PKIECATGSVVGVEALLRWDRPSHGLLLPAEFLPGLRRPQYSDVLVPLTEWVVRTACRQAQQWRDAGRAELKVALNMPPSRPHRRKASIAGSTTLGSGRATSEPSHCQWSE